jgi:catabolite repression protein CreC
VRWVPTSHTLFLVSYADGTIVIFDKEREDGVFSPQDPNKGGSTSVAPAKPDDSTASTTNSSTVVPSLSSPDSKTGEWDPSEEMFVSMPPWHPASPAAAVGREGAGKSEKAGKNPISHWRLSRRSVVGKAMIIAATVGLSNTIVDFVFSPDVRYVAAVSEDGCLRIIDTLSER